MNPMIKLIFSTGCILLLMQQSHAATNIEQAKSGFARIQSMVGNWQGKLPNGNNIEISYEEINGGAIVERYRSEDPMWWNMSTAYHLDNEKIMMSHYCSWGNHPRMSAVVDSAEAKKIDFNFLDIAQNEPQNGYMRDLEIEFVDSDHVVHYWLWRQDGKDTPLKLTLTRVK